SSSPSSAYSPEAAPHEHHDTNGDGPSAAARPAPHTTTLGDGPSAAASRVPHDAAARSVRGPHAARGRHGFRLVSEPADLRSAARSAWELRSRAQSGAPLKCTIRKTNGAFRSRRAFRRW